MSKVQQIFSNEQEFKKMVEGLFQKIDKDKSGFISNKELETALQSFAKESGISPPSKKDLQAVMASYDENKDGKISLEEFGQVIRKTYDPQSKSDKPQESNRSLAEAFLLDEKQFDAMCQTVFDEIDTEKNKTISITELENATKKLAEQFKMAQPTKEEIQKEFKSIDQNKDKTLDFKEFKTYMRSLFGKHLQPSKSGKSMLITEVEQVEKAESPEVESQRKKLADQYLKYIDDTGLSMAFKIIYAEILSKKIAEEDVYAYTVMRLRQIGNDIAYIQNIKLKKKAYH